MEAAGGVGEGSAGLHDGDHLEAGSEGTRALGEPPNQARSGDEGAADVQGPATLAQLGCSKCRYSAGGCARCRNPHFRPRGSVPRDELAAVAKQARRAKQRRASGEPGEPADTWPAKRQRRAAGVAASSPHQGPGSLVSQLRRHLGQSEPSGGAAEGLAKQMEGLHTWAAGEGAAPPAAPPAPAPQQRGVPHPESAAAAAAPSEAVPTAATTGAAATATAAAAQPPWPPDEGGEPQGVCGSRKQAPGEAGTGGGGSEPPRSLQRPSKQRRVGEDAELPVAVAMAVGPQRAKRPRSPVGEQALAAGAPPRRYRKVLPPHEQQGQQAQQAQQSQQGHASHAAGAEMDGPAAEAPGSGAKASSAGSLASMDIDLPEGAGGSAGTGSAGSRPASPGEGAWMEGAGAGAAAAAAGAAGPEARGAPAAAGSKRSFLSLLEANMERRRRERRESGAPGAAPQLLLPAGKRQRRALSQPATSPAGSAGAAAAAEASQEPDPRLCLWEPPVSPYGLLEEELYDDPWKLLVACMLLNKTTGTQVRKVIWDLFTLCPSPAAAVGADVAAIEALIQPLGLFRKRAVAIQKLSQDYLEKQWRDPLELFGIGKYAADAYQIFCRGRWRETEPEDKDLLKYLRWLEGTGGVGSGLSRHRTVEAAAANAAVGPAAAGAVGPGGGEAAGGVKI